MRFDVFTLFPDAFQPYLQISILERAIEKGLLQVHLHDIRAWTKDKHHITDDAPYGGGGGMVMKPEPAFSAVEAVLGIPPTCPLILLTPQGRIFNQQIVEELSLSIPTWHYFVDGMKVWMNESASISSQMKYPLVIMFLPAASCLP